MKKYKLLVLTDHLSHTSENSIYPLLLEMLRHKRCESIYVASRGQDANKLFFETMEDKCPWAIKVDASFAYSPQGLFYRRKAEKVCIPSFDAVLLRLPHPVSESFWSFLETAFPTTLFINRPSGIQAAANKLFLLNFPELCAPMQLCQTLDEIAVFKSRFPIVLKPVLSYGGKGIIKIIGDEVMFSEGEKTSWEKFAENHEAHPVQYLGMRYLENVNRGDKRIVVCCGEVLGAALRYPAPGSWVCNVARGGSAVTAVADEDELKIVEVLDRHLQKLGVVLYGIDTLVNDNGKRVLSEINAMSIGGMHALYNLEGVSAIERASACLWNYVHSKHS